MLDNVPHERSQSWWTETAPMHSYAWEIKHQSCKFQDHGIRSPLTVHDC
jgi:hypothetical protein